MKRKRTNIKRRLPPVGTKLIGKFFGKPYNAQIVADKNISMRKGIYYNGKIYSSMTTAAIAITKQPTNG